MFRSQHQHHRVGWRLVCVIGAAVLPGACTDVRAATKDNLAAALKDDIALLACRQLPNGDIRITPDHSLEPPLPIVRLPADRSGSKRTLKTLDDLVTAGVLARTSANVASYPYPGSPAKTVSALIYTPTPAAKDIVVSRNILVRKLHVDVALLCAGHGELVAIDNFTVPADMFGVKFTQVSYRWHQVGMSALGRAAMAAFEPAATVALDRDQLARATLILTDNGWVERSKLGY